MSLVDEYKNQYQWRSWDTIYALLPDLAGQTVLDLGCGAGNQAVDFTERGARVIGVDLNDDLLKEAQSRCPKRARFIKADFRKLPNLNEKIDGVWSGFSTAYLNDLVSVLESWNRQIKVGGWIALTEIDNLFGHEPLSEATQSLLEGYCKVAYEKGRYDFYMGRKLEKGLHKSGFSNIQTLTLNDLEFSFFGPASQGVVSAWEKRFDRMTLLREFCGPKFEHLKNEFLDCLDKEEHRSLCKVYCCIAQC